MLRRLALGVLCALSCAAAVTPFPPLSNEDWERLRAGEIVVHPTRDEVDGAYVVTIAALYEEEPEVVWDVVADCARFHEFMPRMSESQVTRSPDGSTLCKTVSDLPMPLSDLVSQVRTWNETPEDRSFERHFEQVPGEWSYKRNEGRWSVSPHEGPGGRTLLRYQLAVKPRIALPEFIVRAAQNQTAPESFEAIRSEARKRRPSEVSAGPN
jgi:ribosome-associated toxin RatA of RatAB toxin-antitoxin module